MHAAFDGRRRSSAARARTRSTSRSPAARCRAPASPSSASTRRTAAAASLRAMMRRAARDVHERGEPIAALWASEETIYGRFGYGIASWACEIDAPRVWSAFAQPLERRGAGALRDAGGGAELFPPVWDALRAAAARRALARSRAWWELRTLRDPGPTRRREPDAASSCSSSTAQTQAYAIYRREAGFGRTAARAAKLEVHRGDRRDAAGDRGDLALPARRRLDRRRSARSCCRPTTRCSSCSRNPRRLRYRIGRRALGAARRRRRGALGARVRGRRRIVFEVRDAVCPWNEGRWALENGARRAHGGRRRARARRRRARLGVSRRRLLRASFGRAARVEELAAGRGRARGRAVRMAPAALVPGDLLSASARLPSRPGRLAQLGEHQLDKLGVTGSSPVPPIT